jgi:hypothetical protein
MSFQWIIDNASEITAQSRPVVASTITRDGRVRSVSRGAQPWIFTVTLPNGPRWQEYRSLIAQAEASGRFTDEVVQFNNAGHDWLFAYQGDMSGSLSASWTQGATSLSVSTPIGETGDKLVAGDLIQLNTNGPVYKVESTVPHTQNTVNVHRPILDNSGSGTLNVGVDCAFTVRCTQFPDWTIFERDQIGWLGSFIFTEVF